MNAVRLKRSLLLLLVFAFVGRCQKPSGFCFEQVWPFDDYISMDISPLDKDMVFMSTLAGTVSIFDVTNGAFTFQREVLFIQDRVEIPPDSEAGFHDLVFDPDFENHPFAYVTYSCDPEKFPECNWGCGNPANTLCRFENCGCEDNAELGVRCGASRDECDGPHLPDDLRQPNYELSTVVSRFTVEPNGNIVRDSEDVLFIITEPHYWHLLSQLLFGPDGMLYIFSGDSGLADDPLYLSQSLKSPQGKVLRIDVRNEENGRKYAIPDDNPFVGRDDALGEIWALGLRGNWRNWIEPETGRILTGDVGQYTIESVLEIEKGHNYGWRKWEGRRLNRPNDPDPVPDAQFPLFQYTHQFGVAIIGGFVYNGAVDCYNGYYIFADTLGKVGAALDGEWDCENLSCELGKVCPEDSLVECNNLIDRIYNIDMDGNGFLYTMGIGVLRLVEPERCGFECDECIENRDSREEIDESHIIVSIGNIVNQQECCERCLDTDLCLAYNYERSRDICVLYNVNGEVVAATGWHSGRKPGEVKFSDDFDRFRPDQFCGPRYLNEFGDPAECNPESDTPCCQTVNGFCGNTPGHCTCDVCIDYRDIQEVEIPWGFQSYDTIILDLGDALVFNWEGQQHNVWLLPNQGAYDDCEFENAQELAAITQTTYRWSSSSSGVYYFACQLPQHCNPRTDQMRVTVLVGSGMAPPPGECITCSTATCNALNLTPPRGFDVCADTAGGNLGTCNSAKDVTLAEANARCQEAGMRTCTLQELQDDIAANTGCGLDNELVWTTTQCTAVDVTGFFATAGERSGGPSPMCLTPQQSANSRCCADTSIATPPCCDGGAITWREDNQCGPMWPNAMGSPAECNPDGVYPCCNLDSQFCGETPGHCDCANCIDYRDGGGSDNPWRSDLQCGENFENDQGQPAECNPDSQAPCCNLNTGFCGNTADHCSCSDACIDFRRPQGEKVYLTGEEDSDWVALDGRVRPVYLFNGQYQGPEIRVREGDTVVINIRNLVLGKSFTIHWHGLHQIGTPWSDGPPNVAQCVIPTGETFEYKFVANQRGTYWYHTHTDAIRAEGLVGALIIEAKDVNELPEEYRYDDDIVVGVSEWYSDMVTDRMMGGRAPQPRGPVVSWDGNIYTDYESSVINGIGKYNNNAMPYRIISVKRNDRYRLRLIHQGFEIPYRISIDNHLMTVISADGHEIEPIVEQTSVYLFVGERLDVIVETSQATGNYWIRAETVLEPDHPGALAILRYENAPDENPTTADYVCTADMPCQSVNCPWPAVNVAGNPLQNTVCTQPGDFKAAPFLMMEGDYFVPNGECKTCSSRTCSRLKLDVVGNTGVCADSAGGALGKCDEASGLTYRQAKRRCEDARMRLCTRPEMEANIAANTGCSLDSSRIWTSTPCEDGYYVVAGEAGQRSTRCYTTDRTVGNRCCADEFVNRAPCCDATEGEPLRRYFFNTDGFLLNGKLSTEPDSLMLLDRDIENRCKYSEDPTFIGQECVQTLTLKFDRPIEFVFMARTNAGASSAGHPMHLHGHSFYVMKQKFGDYLPVPQGPFGQRFEINDDIVCDDPQCNRAHFDEEPDDYNLINPPQKDVLFHPYNGYTVVRFQTNNPGLWLMHCHILLHTRTMSIIIEEAPGNFDDLVKEELPKGFPTQCSQIEKSGAERDCDENTTCADQSDLVTGLSVAVGVLGVSLIVLGCLYGKRRSGYDPISN